MIGVGEGVHIRRVTAPYPTLQINLESGANSGGELTIVDAIVETTVIERILEHLGLPARAPPRTPARVSMSQAA